MQISMNNAEASYALSRGWTDISAQGSPRKIADVLREQGYDIDKMPLKIDISEEGLSAYKHMSQNQNNDGGVKVYQVCIPCDKPVEYGGEGWPAKEEFLGQGFATKMIGSKYPQSYYFNAYVPIQDKAAALLNAYKKSYDEIVKGYENGTRERYVIDRDTEKQYRKATMEEDLEDLRKAFEGFSDVLERYVHEYDCWLRERRAAIALSELADGTLSLGKAMKRKMLYESMKGDEEVADIKQKLVDAGSLFVSQYKELGLNKLQNTDFFDNVTVNLK